MKQFNLDEYIKNPSRKIVTRDGRPVRIVCTDFGNEFYPIIGELQDEKYPMPKSFTDKGKFSEFDIEDELDLFFESERKEGWINIFKGEDFYHTFIYNSKEDAEKQGETFYNYVTTIKIEWEE